MATIELELNLTGLNCPLPLLKTKQSIRSLQTGQRIKIHTTDPASQKDFESFTRMNGHILISSKYTSGIFEYIIEVA